MIRFKISSIKSEYRIIKQPNEGCNVTDWGDWKASKNGNDFSGVAVLTAFLSVVWQNVRTYYM
jgi:hypothetical protein